jgi:hypothetical protein
MSANCKPPTWGWIFGDSPLQFSKVNMRRKLHHWIARSARATKVDPTAVPSLCIEKPCGSNRLKSKIGLQQSSSTDFLNREDGCQKNRHMNTYEYIWHINPMCLPRIILSQIPGMMLCPFVECTKHGLHQNCLWLRKSGDAMGCQVGRSRRSSWSLNKFMMMDRWNGHFMEHIHF